MIRQIQDVYLYIYLKNKNKIFINLDYLNIKFKQVINNFYFIPIINFIYCFNKKIYWFLYSIFEAKANTSILLNYFGPNY
jgi:hypothetical protein